MTHVVPADHPNKAGHDLVDDLLEGGSRSVEELDARERVVVLRAAVERMPAYRRSAWEGRWAAFRAPRKKVSVAT